MGEGPRAEREAERQEGTVERSRQEVGWVGQSWGAVAEKEGSSQSVGAVREESDCKYRRISKR